MSSIKINLSVIISILFFISGSAGLVYEVIWVDLLTNLLGASTIAVTIILTSFMGGLAAGSFTIGLLADRWNNVKIAVFYIFVEIFIGLYALLFPTIVNMVEGFYIEIFNTLPDSLVFTILLKTFFSFIILIIPTFLMGTTLPLISRFLSKNWDQYSKKISLLYGLNTFGAIAGSLIAGFYLLEHYGISGATKFSASINFFIAAIFIILFIVLKHEFHYEIPEIKLDSKRKTKHSREFVILLLISYALSGAAAMFYQVAWTRALSLVLGTSTYAFTTMLATFLFGIALGSILYRFIPQNISRTWIYLVVQSLIVVSVLYLSGMFDKLPLYYLSFVNSFFDRWFDIHYIRFVLAAFIMLLPTLLMGILFPVVCSIASNYSTKMSKTVGKVYAVNSVGAMFGALAAGLAVIPLIGLQNTIYVGAFLNFFAFMIILLQTGAVSKTKKIILFAPLSIAIVIFMINEQKWSPRMMSSGVYVYADNYFFVSDKFDKIDKYDFSHESIWEASMKNFNLLYYKDGIVDTVSVMKNKDGVLSLMVNGKVDASAKGDTDVATQIMIGQLPLLLHKNPKDVFLVGYASGITAGNILTHDIRSLTVAEISSSVIEASRYFNKYNNNPLNDPRTKLKMNDARQMLMTSTQTYDVIVSQPSNPWIKGQSSLFSYDWYEIVKEHLEDDGIFMQWLPAYSISENNLKIILNTISKAFPTLTLWSSSSPGDLIILASKNEKFTASYGSMLEKCKNPKVLKQLQKISLNPQTLLQELFLKSNKELEKYLYEETDSFPINKDDKLIIEYSTPKNMINDKLVKIFSKEKFLDGDENSLKKIIPDL